MTELSVQPREHLDLLFEASQEFNSTLDFDELLPRVFDRTLDILEAEAGSIWLREGDHIVCRIARGPVSEQIEGLELPLGAGIVGHIAHTGEPELVADARNDPRFVHQVDEATGFATRSMVAAPLKAKDTVLGVIQVLNKRSDTGLFGERDLALVSGLAGTAGLALRNAQLHDAERRAHDLKTLLGISREVASTLDVDRLAGTVVNLASQALSYDRAAIALDEGGRTELKAISGQDEVDRSDATRELESLILWLAERGETVYVADLSADDEVAESIRRAFPDYVERTGIRALGLIPLKDEEGRLGAFYMESATPGFLGEAGREAAELLANQISVSVRNADLYSQVPFIGFLEPLAAWRRRITSMPRSKLATRIGIPTLLILIVVLFPWAERIGPRHTEILPEGRMPVRATVGGLLSEIRVDEGVPVERGDILAVLRDDDIRMAIQEASAELAIAEREAAAAQARGDEAAARIAQIDIRQLTERLRILDERLERTRLRAEVPGVVLTPRLEEQLGGWLAAGETFVVLGRTDRLEVESFVAQEDIDRVEPGQRVRLKVPALPNYTFVGTVNEIAPYADSTSAGEPTFVVRAGLDNERGLLRPGMDARAKIVGSRRPLGYLLIRPFVRWIQMRFWR
ncbi:MAG: GAF domain-containing protein [Gemmatimonadetes bacterium]|nr:GAF domain-containing protein [Gemmatimonadota bacterium]